MFNDEEVNKILYKVKMSGGHKSFAMEELLPLSGFARTCNSAKESISRKLKQRGLVFSPNCGKNSGKDVVWVYKIGSDFDKVV